ncbi:NfeD family protein [Thiomonas sp.]|jgi:membrane protein implicated in regulation of membrane protease activity|uniref:NfeD family protein n=1 Tax=Thiomonas sp. TaxID=2047785 RepID=UPI002618AD0D|nr:NfeD family protein [Thiomonas sp.]
MPSTPLQWWIATAVLVALELGSGSFYLLMLAVGAAAGALAAHLGLDVAIQWSAAALVGIGAVALLYLTRRRAPRRALQSNRDVNLDIGSVVEVRQWDPAGNARIRWRGTEWQARLGRGPALPGRFRIAAVDANTLVLDALDPPPSSHS